MWPAPVQDFKVMLWSLLNNVVAALRIFLLAVRVPGLTLGTSTFGVISSLQTADALAPRSLQMTGRVTF
jgi:hypothetical protein